LAQVRICLRRSGRMLGAVGTPRSLTQSVLHKSSLAGDSAHMKAQVVMDYDPDGEHTDHLLRLAAGDIVYVLEPHESGWWGGHKEGGDVTGWFPACCVKKVHSSGQLSSNDGSVSPDSVADPLDTISLRVETSGKPSYYTCPYNPAASPQPTGALDKLQELHNQLEDELAAERKTNSELRDTMQKERRCCEALQRELDVERSRMMEVDADLERLEAEQALATQLRMELEVEVASLRCLESEKTAAVQSQKQLEWDVAGLQEEKVESVRRQQELEEELTSMRSDLATSRERVAELESQEEQVAELLQQLDVLEKQVAQFAASREQGDVEVSTTAGAFTQTPASSPEFEPRGTVARVPAAYLRQRSSESLEAPAVDGSQKRLSTVPLGLSSATGTQRARSPSSEHRILRPRSVSVRAHSVGTNTLPTRFHPQRVRGHGAYQASQAAPCGQNAFAGPLRSLRPENGVVPPVQTLVTEIEQRSTSCQGQGSATLLPSNVTPPRARPTTSLPHRLLVRAPRREQRSPPPDQESDVTACGDGASPRSLALYSRRTEVRRPGAVSVPLRMLHRNCSPMPGGTPPVALPGTVRHLRQIYGG